MEELKLLDQQLQHFIRFHPSDDEFANLLLKIFHISESAKNKIQVCGDFSVYSKFQRVS